MNNKKQLLETFVGVEEHTRVQRRYKYCFYFLSLERRGLKSQKLEGIEKSLECDYWETKGRVTLGSI